MNRGFFQKQAQRTAVHSESTNIPNRQYYEPNQDEQRKIVYKGRKKVWVLSDTIPAGAQDFVMSRSLDGNMSFECKELAGAFETLTTSGGNVIDNGVCYHRIKLTDAGTDYQFTDTYVPADLLLAPGRRKSSLAQNNNTTVGAFSAADVANPLYKFISFQHTFTDKLEVRVANDSNTALKIWVMFVGYETRIEKVRR